MAVEVKSTWQQATEIKEAYDNLMAACNEATSISPLDHTAALIMLQTIKQLYVLFHEKEEQWDHACHWREYV